MEETMTFANLDAMIDDWTREIYNCQVVFKNQAYDVTNNYLTVINNKEKITSIAERLCILTCMNGQLDRDLQRASDVMKTLEAIVVQLQNIVVMMQDKTPIDVPREKIFGLGNNINSCLCSCQEDVELLTKQVNQKNSNDSHNPAQQVASIMMILLRSLEDIELKMEQMKGHMNWIHHEYKRISGAN